jgi:hypothetical protein
MHRESSDPRPFRQVIENIEREATMSSEIRTKRFPIAVVAVGIVLLSVCVQLIASGILGSEAGAGAGAKRRWHRLNLSEGYFKSQIHTICLNDPNCADWSPPSYFKDESGFVHLRGVIRSSPSSSSTVGFKLPQGFRPSGTAGYGAPFQANDGSISVEGLITITKDGKGFVATPGAGSYSPIERWGLDGITFRAQ